MKTLALTALTAITLAGTASAGTFQYIVKDPQGKVVVATQSVDSGPLTCDQAYGTFVDTFEKELETGIEMLPIGVVGRTDIRLGKTDVGLVFVMTCSENGLNV